LIFLDLNMPRINGCEFLAIVNVDQCFKSIPTVVLPTSLEFAYKLTASLQASAIS